MAEANLNTNTDIGGFDAGIDSVVISNYIEGVPGGRSLDVTGFTPTVIKAGHVVIKETSTGTRKPMPAGKGVILTISGAAKASGTLVAGTTTALPLKGGSGTGATATIVCGADELTSATLVAGGAGYKVGDVLTAVVAGGTVTMSVATISGADGAYDALPSGHTYEGVTVASVLATEPIVGIMVRGSVNETASPYPVTSAMKSALTHIRFIQD